MRFPEYDDLDALALADHVRTKQVSAEEVLEAAIERIEARNPRLAAVVHPSSSAPGATWGACPTGLCAACRCC